MRDLFTGIAIMLLAVSVLLVSLSLSHRISRLEVIVNGVFSGGNKVEPK